jgi:acetyl-CoA acyltransferase
MQSQAQKVAIVDGVRTPFVKAGGPFADYTFQELGAHTLKALLTRNDIAAADIEEVHYSTVLLDPQTPNWAREIVFAAKYPASVYAHAVSNNCISGVVAIAGLAERISAGRVKVGVAGGSESMSNTTLRLSPRTNKMFMKLARARTLGERLKIAASLFGNPKNLMPVFSFCCRTFYRFNNGAAYGDYCQAAKDRAGKAG